MCPPVLHFYMCSRWCGVCADRKLSIKSFSPLLDDAYRRLIIESGGCLEVVTTTQVSEESMWVKQLAFCFRLGNRSERSTEFLMGRQDFTSKANKHYCLFHLLIVCYGGQGPPPETVGHHSCYKWAGDTPNVGGCLRKYTSMPFEIVTCKSRWCWKPSLM